MKDQNQNSGDNSTNIQAGTIIMQGVSATEARQIALDVYHANFLTLAGEAKDTACKRAEEITEDFLKKLQHENPNGIQKSKDPDFQYSLYTVQKEYAKSGDKDLGDLLVDLLVDRSKQDKRDII